MMSENNSPKKITSQEIVVSVSNVSKTYQLYSSHQDRIKEALHPFRKRYYKEFTALDGVSFAIHKGQSVGILGRNGAGKSTLLQLIAGVINPTHGHISVVGKVVALLELGAGFNPDLTGRENVILSNTIQGIDENEIKKNVEAVEAFADVGLFFDQPLKVYSSGMYARVAFANAITVKPDVLIIDEILGVGDAKFQEKCYNKITTLRESGVCIIFVSHSTELIQRNCDLAVLLDKGELLEYGTTAKSVAAYYDLLYGAKSANSTMQTYQSGAVEETIISSFNFISEELTFFIESSDIKYYNMYGYYNKYERRIGNRDAEIIDFIMLADTKSKFNVLTGTEKIEIYIKVKFKRKVDLPQFGWALVTTEGLVIAGSNTLMQKTKLSTVNNEGIYIYVNSIDLVALCGGQYFISIGVGEHKNDEWSYFDLRNSVIHIAVKDSCVASGFFEIPSAFKLLD